MISYETTLKLKEAGFKIRRCEYAREDMESRVCVYCEQPCFELGDTGEYYVLPTLAELIEACRPAFCSLSAPFFNVSLKWEADSDFYIRALGREPGIGETPEEAVANLYLLLAKK